MNSLAATPLPRLWIPPAGKEAVCWAGGIAFTFALFFAMAHFEAVESEERISEIESLPAGSFLLEPPPPPPPLVEPAPPEESMALTGIEAMASDSAVKVMAVPPDLEALMPEPVIPRTALVEIGRFYPELKPAIDADLNASHVYQQSEVDQPPRAILRIAPLTPSALFGKATSMRVVLLLLIDPQGRVESTRVVTTSGNADFDALFAKTVKEEWVFSAAVKRGRAVRCLAEQGFRVNLPGATPFSLE